MKKTGAIPVRTIRKLSALIGLIAWICLTALGRAVGQDNGIIDLQPWRGYFGGKETVFRFAVHGVRPAGGRLVWRLAVMERTAARGERMLAVDEGHAAVVAIPLQLPDTKPGVVVDALLEVGLEDPARNQTVFIHRKALRLYPENPFFGQTARMADYNIHLYDPEAATADRLAEFDVPFSPVSNINALEGRQGGILIIGEGVSLRDYRGLFRQTIEAAARGMRVLYLAPAGGEIELPGLGKTDLPYPRSLLFHGKEVIHRYDKKLDAGFWPPDGAIAATGLTPSGDRERVVGVFGNGVGGWPWVELKYPSGGRLVLCGFGIMANWDAGPAPRFLLREIIDDFGSK